MGGNTAKSQIYSDKPTISKQLVYKYQEVFALGAKIENLSEMW